MLWGNLSSTRNIVNTCYWEIYLPQEGLWHQGLFIQYLKKECSGGSLRVYVWVIESLPLFGNAHEGHASYRPVLFKFRILTAASYEKKT